MMIWRFPDKPIEISPADLPQYTEADWLGQKKYDGWNMTICIDPRVRCLSSRNQPMAKISRLHFDASIVEQIESLGLPSDTVLGTEFMGPRGDHEPGVFIFDCYAYDGEWLTTTPYEDRWNQCCELEPQLSKTPRIHLAETREAQFLDFFQQLKTEWQNSGRGLSDSEGIVLKRKTGTLLLDRSRCQKNRSMFKCKFRDIKESQWES